MARERYKPEEIVSLLRQAEVLHGQGLSMADAIRQIGISEVTFYRWRKEYGGMSGDQLRRLKLSDMSCPNFTRAGFAEWAMPAATAGSTTHHVH